MTNPEFLIRQIVDAIGITQSVILAQDLPELAKIEVTFHLQQIDGFATQLQELICDPATNV